MVSIGAHLLGVALVDAIPFAVNAAAWGRRDGRRAVQCLRAAIAATEERRMSVTA